MIMKDLTPLLHERPDPITSIKWILAHVNLTFLQVLYG